MSYYNNYSLGSSGYPSFAPSAEQYYPHNFDPYYSYQNSGPPPPVFPLCDQPNTYDLFLPQDVTPAQHKTDDHLLIVAWLEKIGKSSIKPKSRKKSPKCPIQIHVAKKSLRDCLQVRSTLQLCFLS